MDIIPATLSPQEGEFLKAAADYLERPTFLMVRIANLVGKPASDSGLRCPTGPTPWWPRLRPRHWPLRRSGRYAQFPNPRRLARVGAALRSKGASPVGCTRCWATTGAVGGFFGLPALPIELPATTIVMLRSIAEIAAQHGADLSDPSVRMQCLAVFSFGSPAVETMESAYFTGRLGLALAVKDAAAFVVGRHPAGEISEAVTKGSAPMLVRLINLIAGRFQVVVTEKVVAQAVPIAARRERSTGQCGIHR